MWPFLRVCFLVHLVRPIVNIDLFACAQRNSHQEVVNINSMSTHTKYIGSPLPPPVAAVHKFNYPCRIVVRSNGSMYPVRARLTDWPRERVMVK